MTPSPLNPRIRSTELHHHIGETVHLAGWLHQMRRLGRLNFLILRDGAGTCQVVLTDPEELAKLKGLQVESVLAVEGTVVAEPQAPGGVEVHDPHITILSPVSELTPFELNKPVLKSGLDLFLDHAPIGLRHPHKRALFRLFAALLAAFREFLDADGFVEIQTPKLVGSATEGGANVFRVDYFGRPAFLAQSPQFYKQIMVGIFERVYEVGPVFRAEPHDTIRHTNEYVSLDVEMGFIEDHHTVMALLARLMRHLLARLQERHGEELAFLGVAMPVVGDPIPILHFREAQELIRQRFGEDCRGEPDLAPQHERRLGEIARADYASDFLFVTGYPTVKRPFYTYVDPQDPTYTYGFDLLFRGCEIATGGQRVHSYAQLVAALEQRGLNPADFAYYLEAFKYGMPPHGGFAIGAERLLMQLTGVENLRETTLFPRDTSRLTP